MRRAVVRVIEDDDLASCEIHTASPESGGLLPGLPVAEAEALRSRLAARGEAQRAGL